jgi:murein L,D-transpeptidase YafK
MTLRPASLLALPAFVAALAFTTPSASRGAEHEIRIAKGAHSLSLLADGAVVRTYRVAIGPGGPGPKRMEGDRVTPVGSYRVVSHIHRLYHQFLSLDYPNAEDRRRFAALKAEGGVPPGVGVGFGIGIHGTGHADWNGVHKETDWTLGCVALDDAEIDEVAAWAKDGTRVVITD